MMSVRIERHTPGAEAPFSLAGEAKAEALGYLTATTEATAKATKTTVTAFGEGFWGVWVSCGSVERLCIPKLRAVRALRMGHPALYPFR
jgi:hypothetical protein